MGEQKSDGTVFDPEDPSSARTWISYKDADGNVQKRAKAFSYDGTKADLKNVAALLAFTSGDDALDSFLRNLQVYSRGYFAKYPAGKIDFLA